MVIHVNILILQILVNHCSFNLKIHFMLFFNVRHILLFDQNCYVVCVRWLCVRIVSFFFDTKVFTCVLRLPLQGFLSLSGFTRHVYDICNNCSSLIMHFFDLIFPCFYCPVNRGINILCKMTSLDSVAYATEFSSRSYIHSDLYFSSKHSQIQKICFALYDLRLQIESKD